LTFVTVLRQRRSVEIAEQQPFRAQDTATTPHSVSENASPEAAPSSNPGPRPIHNNGRNGASRGTKPLAVYHECEVVSWVALGACVVVFVAMTWHLTDRLLIHPLRA
jgi:hypothetical protein